MNQRIEDRSSIGVPDLNLHIPSIGDVWIEMKFHFRLPTRTVRLGLSNQQSIWLIQNQAAGRKCALLCRLGNLWCLWNTTRAYRMATKSWSWPELTREAACMYDDPDLILQYLAKEINDG